MNDKNKSNKLGIIAYLRLLFICLSVGCLMQIVHEINGILPGSAHVYYFNDAGSSNQRRLDIDIDIIIDSPLKFDNDARNPIPKLTIDPLFRQEQDRIDKGMDDASRCAQYGVTALPDNEKYERRIFFGSMLADENPEVIMAQAVEVYNKYSVVALVESNTTHLGTARRMKYGPGSMSARALEEGGMFGTAENTKTIIDYWLEDMPDLKMMSREVEQRNAIWKIWVDQGMTERDVGIMADLDEIVSRDFLNAVRVCDFPSLQYNPNHKPSCQTPKMVLSTIQFESTPFCVKHYEWFHPDLISGSCILGVGDPSGRVTPERTHRANGQGPKIFGHRTDDWGTRDYKRYPQDVIENNRFPLWDGRDIREVNGSNEPLVSFVDEKKKGHGKTSAFGTAYHLHNWFRNMDVLRHKFATYGHADKGAMTVPLSDWGGDINMMVRCARGLGNNFTNERDFVTYYENNELLPEEGERIFSLGGNRPIYFQNRSYVKERHALVQKMLRADEEKYGTKYQRGSR